MSHTVLKTVDVPMFALVELMGHTRHDCALVTPARLAGVELTALTYFDEGWSAVEGDMECTIRTKYYGRAAFYSITPMDCAAARLMLATLPGEQNRFLALLETLADDERIMAAPDGPIFADVGRLIEDEKKLPPAAADQATSS